MPARTPILLLCLAALAAPVAITGCASTTIKLKEAFGIEKRQQLVSEVGQARDAQEEAREQFATTLDEFKALTGYDGGELERAYNRLSSQADRSRSRASTVSRRIESVERIANAMFREWDQELKQYSSDSLRAASAEQLAVTRQRYQQMLGAMKTAEARMGPVLAAFDDQVLFLKHNLNARAIASLQTSVGELETEIQQLIDEMNTSIDEANAFIQGMDT